MKVNGAKPDAFRVWLMASRPKTLPAAAAPVIVGSAVAITDGNFQLVPALAALLAALLLQIGANLANDVFDFQRGADTHERLGPLRVTHAGWLSSEQVILGMLVVFGLATLFGLYLMWVAGWPVILLGLASIIAAVTYTGGPLPFGYYGLGDFFAFVFFGPVAVCGAYFVQAGTVTPLAFWSSIPIGLLVCDILVVNNLRDIDTDRAAGKRTLAVRLGRRAMRWEYLVCLVGAYAMSLILWLRGLASVWLLLSWLSIPMAISLVRMVWRQQGRPLNQALAGTGQLTLAYGVLYALGLLLASLISSDLGGTLALILPAANPAF